MRELGVIKAQVPPSEMALKARAQGQAGYESVWARALEEHPVRAAVDGRDLQKQAFGSHYICTAAPCSGLLRDKRGDRRLAAACNSIHVHDFFVEVLCSGLKFRRCVWTVFETACSHQSVSH